MRFICSVPHSQSGANAAKSDWPNGVSAYSTRGGTSLKSLRLTMPSASISLRCWISIFSLIPSTTRRNSPKRAFGTEQTVDQRTADQRTGQAAVDDAKAQIRDAEFD